MPFSNQMKYFLLLQLEYDAKAHNVHLRHVEVLSMVFKAQICHINVSPYYLPFVTWVSKRGPLISSTIEMKLVEKNGCFSKALDEFNLLTNSDTLVIELLILSFF